MWPVYLPEEMPVMKAEQCHQKQGGWGRLQAHGELILALFKHEK